jgi:hypothetical protein
MNNKEYDRGAKFAQQENTRFRSYKKNVRGDLIGYTKTGSKQIILRKEDLKSKSKGFHKGYIDTFKLNSNIKKVKTKKRNNSSYSGLGQEWKNPFR